MDRLLASLDRGLTWLARCAAHAAAILAILVAGFVALSAAMRYFVGRPFAFSDELVGLMVVTLAFMALPHALAENRHIRITALTDRLPTRMQKLAGAVGLAILLGFVVVFGLEMRAAIAYAIRFNVRGEMGGLPLYPWMLTIPVALALTGLLATVRFLRATTASPGSIADDR